jgi:predicted MFS family arabinose efflux permease
MRDPAPLTPQPAYLEHAAARRIVVGVLLTMLLSALDQVMVATALPTIAAALGDVENMSWVVTANLLCQTAATPLYGKLSDIHGRRTMLLIAIGVYAAGSLACALAPTMLALILGRALQGLGGGGLMPLVQTIIGDIASPRDRPRYQSYTSSTFIVSMVGGPLLGGFVAEQLHWSWIFWINLPLCALAYLLTNNVLQRLPRHERRHQLDVLGAALMVGAAIALMLALTWGGRRYGWASPQIAALCGVSAALWVLFAWRMTTAEEPFIPLAVLRDGAMRGGTGAAFFAVGTIIALTIILPLYAQLALGLIALAGFGMGPMFPFTIVVVQNAVAPHQLGIATGTMNFFRALGSTFIVTGFGAIVLAAGAPAVRSLPDGTVLVGADAGEAFRWVFAAAIACLLVALACLGGLEERPLRGSSLSRPAATAE